PAVGELPGQQVARGPGDVLLPLAAEERHQEDVFGFEDGVPLQLADPVAVVGLPGEQVARGAVDGRGEGGRGDRFVAHPRGAPPGETAGARARTGTVRVSRESFPS